MIKKIRIKMLSLMRIEPTPTGVEAGIKIKSVTWKTILRSTSGPLTSPLLRTRPNGIAIFPGVCAGFTPVVQVLSRLN